MWLTITKSERFSLFKERESKHWQQLRKSKRRFSDGGNSLEPLSSTKEVPLHSLSQELLKILLKKKKKMLNKLSSMSSRKLMKKKKRKKKMNSLKSIKRENSWEFLLKIANTSWNSLLMILFNPKWLSKEFVSSSIYGSKIHSLTRLCSRTRRMNLNISSKKLQREVFKCLLNSSHWWPLKRRKLSNKTMIIWKEIEN